MAKGLEKIPPQNVEAEEALLGSLLIDKEAIFKVADQVSPSDFYKDIHRLIYEAMLEVWERKEPIDILSVADRLEERGELKIIGRRSYLAHLTNIVPSSSHIISYAQIVQRKATLRKLIEVSSDITKIAYEEKEETEKILDQSEQRLFSVSQRFLKQNFVPVKDILVDAFERIDELSRGGGKMRGISSGFLDLDQVLAGFQKANLIILAARPSVGKSALALDIVKNVAIDQKLPVGIFSLEMSREQIVDRLIAACSGVNLWRMRTGYLSRDENDFQRINEAINLLSQSSIYIDDSPTANILEIRSKARRLQSEYGLGLIVLDYLQLMESQDNRENRVQEVSEISRALKALARELNVPVLAISQLSRAVESRTPAIPKLADLRESGSLEQDADVVLFIYRKILDRGIKFCPPEERHLAEIHVAKHRHGPAGVIVNLYFDDETASFKNLETKLKEPFEEEPF